MNTATYMQSYLFTTLVVCGLAQYFTGISAFLWLPFLLALGMVLLLPLQTRYSPLHLDHATTLLLVLFAGFFLLALLTTLLQNGVAVTIVGMKNELALSLIFPALLLGFCRESQIYRITRCFYWVFYLQIPVVLYQIVVVVPRRVAIKGEFEKWDSVVGTFGGDPLGGGNTGALGMFCLLIMLLKLSEFKYGLASKGSLALHLLLAFGLCVLGEIKFVIFLAPLLLTLVWISPGYIRGMKNVDLKKLLLIALGLALILALAVIILAASYSSAFGAGQNKGALDLFLDSLNYIFDPHHINPETGELGRMTTFFFWGANADLHGFSNVLFGYGLNTTNHGSTVAPGYLNLVFNVLLDSTSISMMLWELGLAGCVLFILLFGGACVLAWPKPLLERAAMSDADVRLVSYQPAFVAFTIACLLSLPYSQLLMLIPMLQFLFYFILGAMLVIRNAVYQVAQHGEAQ